jgi:hypothetical protein
MANQWFFTQEEVLSSPSILDGLAPAEERLRRAKGVNFIYQAGILLELPQITLYVAGVFFHRFYMRRSMVEEKQGIHHYVSPNLMLLFEMTSASLGVQFHVETGARPFTREYCRSLLYFSGHRLTVTLYTEHCCHRPLSRKQDRGKLPENQRYYYRRRKSCSEEP